ncbi:MAG: leucine-rich repeat domain-containing protein, partial [Eubacterium sp.]
MKKVLSVFLSVVMLLSITAGIDFSAQAQLASGDCSKKGSSVSWSYDSSTGKLTISGSGEMKNYKSFYSTPWGEKDYDIKSVTVTSGVKSIGDFAFEYCNNLTSLSLPKTLTSIGKYAFYDSSLSKATIPSGVKSVGAWAFASSDKLSSVTIPKSVTEMGSCVFCSCPKLKSAGNLSSNANIKFGWTDKIPENAFNQSALTSVTIPNSVTSIGNSAFCYCSNLKKITIPKNVTSIGTLAFYGCKSLTSISVDKNNKNYSSSDGNLYNKKKTQLIQYSPGKTNTKFTVPKSVTKIAYGAFADSSKLSSVTLPENLKTIGEKAFIGTNLKSITIPDKVETISNNSFYWCSNLSSVKIGSSVKTIGNYAFAGCSKLNSITIPKSVKTIGNGAFSCSSLKSVTIPNNVSEIGDFCFSSCSSLSSVNIGTGVQKIGTYAFHACGKLAKISVDKNNKNYSSLDGNLYNKNKTQLIQYAIGKTSTKYTLPKTVTDIVYGALQSASNLKNVQLTGDLKSIREGTFLYCNNLTSVEIGDNVKSIGNHAF